jgi:hypothetical protein
MKFTPQDIEEFRVRYEKAFGESITYDKAVDMADQLAELYRVILGRPPEPPPGALPGSFPN